MDSTQGHFRQWSEDYQRGYTHGRDARNAEIVELTRWRDAVIDALVVGHIYNKEHDSDPKKAINDLICWENQIALDPLVSSEAQTLVNKGRHHSANDNQALRARVDDLEDRVMEISDRYDNACIQADDWQWCAEARGKRVAELEAQLAEYRGGSLATMQAIQKAIEDAVTTGTGTVEPPTSSGEEE